MRLHVKSFLCPSCGSGNMDPFFETRSVPSNSCILISTREEALHYPTGDIVLGFCRECGFIGNVAYDATLAEYSQRYEATQSCSATFQKFQTEYAGRLIERHGIRGKRIIEIGCGQGEFLNLLCDLGQNRGVGFDPAYRDEKNRNQNPNVVFISDYYSEKYSSWHEADLICCKMTLEHIAMPLKFVNMVRSSLEGRTQAVVFFQVPDAMRILQEIAFEDIYYEHCSYFTKESLTQLFQRCGFQILHLETIYGGQYLTIEARTLTDRYNAISSDRKNLDILNNLVSRFPSSLENKLLQWKRKILDKISGQGRVALWGSGSKASAFTTFLGLANDLEFVVDINPNKHGYYMAGTGQKIVPPSYLQEIRPDTVIVMNAVYAGEIMRQLEDLGVTSDLLSI